VSTGHRQPEPRSGTVFSFAAAHHVPLVAVTVTPHVDQDVWFDDAWLETHLGTDPEPAAAMADELEPWHLKYPGVPVKRALVAGRPADALRRVANNAFALMVGTAGTAFQPLGSVTRSLMESATCPVVVVREPACA
jgi:nucleotide-binding universal stress UspA family protein